LPTPGTTPEHLALVDLVSHVHDVLYENRSPSRAPDENDYTHLCFFTYSSPAYHMSINPKLGCCRLGYDFGRLKGNIREYFDAPNATCRKQFKLGYLKDSNAVAHSVDSDIF